METIITSKERVLAACEFRAPDRIPRFDPFWEYPNPWREALGPLEELNDIQIWAPDETPLPSRARFIKEEGEWLYYVDGWGRTWRRRHETYFDETLEVAMPAGTDIDSIHYEPPDLDSRYLMGHASESERDEALKKAKEQFCVFGKTGGPYLRTTMIRGETQFLMDIAQDPGLAKAIADKTADHLAGIGTEEIRRFGLQDTGMWIYDDMAYNDGPMFSPASFEKVFLPAYRRMIKAYKDAGAKYVFLHSDGDVRPLLDMLVDAGIDGLNPLERRAGMNIVEIRKRYPKLILVGGMCNSDTMINGPIERIEAEAREIIDIGRNGGVVIGAHSIGPDVPLEHYLAYHKFCGTYGNFSNKEGVS